MFSSSSRSTRVATAAVAAQSHAASGRRFASSKSVGLLGLPNVGKSTLFNGLVRSQLALASNRPFATIEPNVACVPVPDPRLKELAKVSGSQKIVPIEIEVHDIAGLVKGASEGAGLGNAFLGNVRNTNALIEVCRCFEDPEVVHVDESGVIDPVRDLQVLENELCLADLQSCEKRTAKDRNAKTPEAVLTSQLLKRAKEVLEDGKPARVLESLLTKEERLVWPKLQLLSQKPILYLCNVGEDDLKKGGNQLTRALADFLKDQHRQAGMDEAAATQAVEARMLVVSAQLEAEAALLSDEDRASFLEAYGLSQTGLDAVTQKAARLLGLQSYFTTGPMESRAWCIPIGATAVEAAAAIHTDISTGFIKADVCPFADFVAAGGEKGAKEKNLIKSVGKDYCVQDGDVIVFKHNTAGAGGKR